MTNERREIIDEKRLARLRKEHAVRNHRFQLKTSSGDEWIALNDLIESYSLALKVVRAAQAHKIAGIERVPTGVALAEALVPFNVAEGEKESK